jgi:hypothetical protein
MWMRIRRWWVMALVAATAACASGSSPAAQSRTASSPTPAAAGAAGAATSGGPCYAGSHAVRSITGRQPVDTPEGAVTPAGSGGSLVLELRAGGRWTLSSDGSAPAVFQVGRYTAEAVITGSLSGGYVSAGATVVFHQDAASGTVLLRTPAGSGEVPISSLGPALAPGGSATITCASGSVRLDSASVTMDLAPAPAGQLVINQSGVERTDACGGRSVAVQGSSDRLHLTGDCPSVEIVGSSNAVNVERVDQVSINGSYDRVTWRAAITRAQPAVTTSGIGDVVARG